MDKEKQKYIEQFRQEGYVLCLDSGGVLRSQVAKYTLNLFGIHAIAAALGDVSTQYFQGYVPERVIGAAKDTLMFIAKARIQEVTEDMAKNARRILVLDSRFLASRPFISPDDPRLDIQHVPDVPD